MRSYGSLALVGLMVASAVLRFAVTPGFWMGGSSDSTSQATQIQNTAVRNTPAGVSNSQRVTKLADKSRTRKSLRPTTAGIR